MKVAEISRLLVERDNFLIITHQHPDGDAFGSSLGLLNTLRENGKKADAYFHEELPINYQSIPQPDSIINDLPYFGDYDYILCLDFSNPKRFGDIDLSTYNSINIDHHPDNSCFAKENFVFPQAAATAEIIYNVLNEIEEWEISKKSATLLMTGILMDTGAFRFDNTSPEVLRCGADLLKLGASYSDIIKLMFFSKPMGFAKMEADIILHHLQTGCNEQYGWFYLTDDMLSSYNIEEKESEGLIDLIRSIKGFEIVAIFKKKDEGYRFSLRSKNKKYSVGKIARELNGGGHELAAGGLIYADTIEDAEKIMLEHVKEELSN